MLNKEKHQLVMGQILKDIYSDTSIAPLLGLKGGTCAYFFYNLPRFSVDLDFDLFSTEESVQKNVLEKMVRILKKYGKIKDQYLKRYTIFVLLSYEDTDHNIKIEINIRKIAEDIKNLYVLKEHLNIPMMVAKKEYLFAGKLAALTLRKELAMRDVYDIYYFAKNNWGIDQGVIKTQTGKNISEQLIGCLMKIESIKNNQILQGLGELLSEKEKNWVKNNLKKEVAFMLKNYISVIKRG